MELNRIYCGDSRNLNEIKDEVVHLTITSPPYFVNKDYEAYLKSIDEYFEMLRDVFKEVHRITIPGGKIIVNLGDIAVGSHFNGGFPEEVMIMPKVVEWLKSFGSYLYARIVWEKDDPWANSSHVSYHSKVQHAEYRILPAWEYVFVFRKGEEARKDKSPEDGRFISKNDWKKLVHGIWKIRSVQRNDIHEAMFPEELVMNCVDLYSFPNDIVFDPFMGSGTVAVVAKKLGRRYLGYDLSQEYVDKAIKRVDSITEDTIRIPKLYLDKTVNKELQETLFGK